MQQGIPQLLKSEFEERRTRNPNFSLRSFARWLEISPAQLSQLMSGKRPMTLKMARKISGRLGHSPAERLEFIKSTFPPWIEKPTKTVTLPEDQFRLIADWYHLAILSLTKIPKARPESAWVARRLGITQSQAREAMDRLCRLGLLETRPKFRQIRDPFSVESPIPSEAIRRFHKQILALASEKIDTVPIELRETQAITLAVNSKKLPLARKLIGEAIDKIEDVLESGLAGEVYTLSVQLFPLTKEGEAQ